MTWEQFYKTWCKDTKRSGGILIGPSIKECFEAYARVNKPRYRNLRTINRHLKRSI